VRVFQRNEALIRRHGPSKDGRLSTPYGATFSRKEREKVIGALAPQHEFF